jgi:hypothetical protein
LYPFLVSPPGEKVRKSAALRVWLWKAGDPGRTRTSDQQLRRLLLYPAELRGRNSS